MKKLKKPSILLFGILLLAGPLLTACAAPTPAPPQTPAPTPAPTPPGVTDLLIGATSLSSGSYIKTVTFVKVMNREIPGIRGTVVETGASEDNLARLKRGDIDLAGIVGSDSTWFAYTATGYYAGKQPFTTARILFMDSSIVTYLAVRADSGIQTLRDLQGKKVFMGATGSSYVPILQAVLDVNGIKVDMVPGTYADGVAAMKDRRIDAFHKGSAPFSLDANFLDINAFTPIRFLSYEGYFQEGIEELPGMHLEAIPTGTIKGVETHPTIKVLSSPATWVALDTFPEDTAYQIAKVFHKNWDKIRPVHGGFPPDPIEPLIGLVNLQGFAPLHAGTVRYLKEIGVDIPAHAIPPEYR